MAIEPPFVERRLPDKMAGNKYPLIAAETNLDFISKIAFYRVYSGLDLSLKPIILVLHDPDDSYTLTYHGKYITFSGIKEDFPTLEDTDCFVLIHEITPIMDNTISNIPAPGVYASSERGLYTKEELKEFAYTQRLNTLNYQETLSKLAVSEYVNYDFRTSIEM